MSRAATYVMISRMARAVEAMGDVYALRAMWLLCARVYILDGDHFGAKRCLAKARTVGQLDVKRLLKSRGIALA